MRCGLIVLAVLALLAVDHGAAAQDSTLAEALFREGKGLMKAGDFTAACPKLAESFRQDEATGTLLALALCQEKIGELASAWTSFNAVVGRSEQEGRADRAGAARVHAAALESRLSRLTVSVNDQAAALSGFVVKRDGLVLPRAAWGTATPIDAGEHVVEASAPGYQPFRAALTLTTEGEAESVEIPSLAPLIDSPENSAQPRPPGPEPVAKTLALPAPSPPANGERPRARSEPGPSPVRIAGFVAGGLGVVSLGVSAGFAIRTAHLNDVAIREGCDPESRTCPAQALPLTDQINEASRLATGFFVAGSLLTVGGLVLYFVGRRSDASARLGLSVSASGSSAGLAVQGRL